MNPYECGPGWLPIISRLESALRLAGWHGEFQLVKEKFGRLSVWATELSEEMYPLVDAAEEASGSVCEECGATGRMRCISGWWRTLCDECEGNMAVRRG